MEKKILIVDDEPNILLSLEFIIQKAGYKVLSAKNGLEALELVQTWNPDLILLDLNMPKLDGLEVCQNIRQNSHLNELKMIMLTVKGRIVEKEKGIALGADAYISKPFSTLDIIKEINHLVPL